MRQYALFRVQRRILYGTLKGTDVFKRTRDAQIGVDKVLFWLKLSLPTAMLALLQEHDLYRETWP